MPPVVIPPPPPVILVYCAQCTLGLGWGVMAQDPRLGHFLNGTFHSASFVQIDQSEAIGNGETYAAFLARMVAKYVH